MNTVARSGLLCYGISLIAIGLIHFISGHSPSGLMPIPDTLAGQQLFRYLDGTLMVIAGACMVFSIYTKWTALASAVLFFALYAFLGLPKEMMSPNDPASWTGAAELVSLCAGALIIARASGSGAWTFFAARGLLVLALIVFGIQHFMYAPYVAGLITSWIPAKLFWAYFVGVAFFVLALSLLGNVLLRWTGLLAALMFLSWLPLLHGPRVAASPQTETEWTSLFVALAMGGIFLILGGATVHSREPHSKTAPI